MKTNASIHLPVTFHGELHDVHLVNFSIDWKEIAHRVPDGISPLFIAPGRVLISMVNVDLRNMRPFSSAFPFRFRYRHIAFRLLVDDRDMYDTNRGIYFLDSFTNNRIICTGGKLLNTFHLNLADIEHNSTRTGFYIRRGDHFVSYFIDPGHVETGLENLHAKISTIDRAYNTDGKDMYRVKICREQWPLLPVKAIRFETNFFTSARLEGVFVVPQTIFYTWEKPEKVSLEKKIEMDVVY